MPIESDKHNYIATKLNATAIILGFTGSIGSGCSYIAEMIPNITQSKYQYFKISAIIREELKKDGNNSPNVDELQTKGNELREQFGPGCLIHALISAIENDEIKLLAENIIIDGIKHAGEIDLLRAFPNFYLFSIHADREIRKNRVIPHIFKTSEEFLKADKRDEHENLPDGQQVKECNYLSDIIIVNEKQIPDAAQNEKEDYVRGIYRDYIKLIEDSSNGNHSPEIVPSTNELCMTMAYSLSKMSSCLKRKVGAVIVDFAGEPNKISQHDRVSTYPYIISSGYNEVPMGSQKCIFHEKYQKCYREYLQEKHAEKIKFCPNCGEVVNIDIQCKTCQTKFDIYLKFCPQCKKEIKGKFICPKCKIHIFEVYLPGGKKSPGKLLDMCRSLHAEEVAILRLAKGTGMTSKNLVLYATTQPCNLCANKIVSAGIDKVVFAEPYTMEEAADILTKGNVTLERFQGVKSTAYFKLYH